MKRTMRRITAMFLAIVMVVSMVGITPIFAADEETTGSAWQIDGESTPNYYTVDATTEGTANGLDVTKTGDYSITKYENDNSDGLSVSIAKTIEPSTTTDNEFEITLKVVTTQDFADLTVSPDAAVVLVFDNSMSMGYDNAGAPLYVPDDDGEYVVSGSSSGSYTSATMPVASVSGDTGYWSRTNTDSGISYEYGSYTYYFDPDGKSGYNLNDGDGIYFIPAADYDVNANVQRWSLYKGARMLDAQDAAVKFIESFAASNYDCSRYISVVEFARNATEIVDWTEIANNEGNLASVEASINNMTTSAYGGTNIDAGLTLAEYLVTDGKSILQNASGEDISAIYVVLLTDGAPTYYYDGSTSTITTSNDFSSTKSSNNESGSSSTTTHTQTYNAATSLDNVADIYTVAFATTGQSTAFNVDGKTMNIGTWLETYIASSDGDDGKLHIDAGEGEALDIAFTDIYNYITRLSSAWEVTDPMGDFINFEKITTTAGNSTDVSDGTITWYLQNSSPSSQKKDSNDFVTESTYTLSYTITLDTEDPDFVDGTYYLTNGQTTLKYFFMDENDDIEDLNISTLPTVDFLVPAVMGYAPEYTLTVQHLDKATGESIYTDTDEDDDTNSGTYKRWTGYTTSDKDEELTNYTYVSAEAPTNASGTLTEDTTVTYYYTKNDDTFTENHYVQVISGWYYDSYNDLVQVVEGTDTVIKDNEGNVTYVLVDTDSTTDTIGTEVTVETITVNNAYSYQSDKTTLDGVFDNSLTATIGTDAVMNLFYDFTTTPEFDFTVEHYVQVVNGVYYDGKNWVSSDAEYVKVDTTSPDPSVTVGSTITTETYATNGGYYSTYSYDHSDPTPTMTVDASGMTLKLYYTLSGDNSAEYTVNHWVEINENGYYYNAAGVATYVANWTTDASGSVKVEDGTYYYGISINNTESTTIGTLVSASALETGVDNYEYDSSISSASATVMSETGTVLDLFYALSNETTYSYTIEYYLEVNSGNWYYEPAVNDKVMVQADSDAVVSYGTSSYVEYTSASLTSSVTGVIYGTDVEVSSYEAALDGYIVAGSTPEDFKVIANGNVIEVYYAPSSSTDVTYSVEYYKLVDGEYVEVTGDSLFAGEEVAYGTEVDLPTGYAEFVTNYTYNMATFNNGTDDVTSGDIEITSSADTIRLYYTPSAMDYTVEYYLLNINTSEYELQDTREDYGVEIATEYLAEIAVTDTQKAEYTPNYTFVKTSEAPMTITEDGMVLKLYYTPTTITYNVEYYKQIDGKYVRDDDATEMVLAMYGQLVTMPTDYSTKYDPKYSYNRSTFNTEAVDGAGATGESFYVTDSTDTLKLFYTPASMSYDVAYFLYDIIEEAYPETATGFVSTKNPTYFDEIIYTPEYAVTGYTLDEVNTAASMEITEDNQVFNLYFYPNTMNYTVAHYVEVQEGFFFYNGEYVASTLADGEFELVKPNAETYTALFGADIEAIVYEEAFENYFYSAKTLFDGEEAQADFIIDAEAMVLNLYYTVEESFDTSASYNVIHYVEVLNGFYYDNGVWVPTTDSGYHLMDADYAIASKLGATHYEIDEQGSFEGYAYVENGTSITIAKDGDNTLELYYDLTVSIPTYVSLTVNWVTTTGGTLATSAQVFLMDDDEAGTVAFGTSYDVVNNFIGGAEYDEDLTQKYFSGYTFKYMSDETALEGNLFGNVEITYVYSKNSSYTPSTPSTPDDDDDDDDNDDTVVTVPDEDVPLTDIPDEDVPLTDIPDEDVPLTDIPDEDVPLMEIPEEDVPLSDIPQTGDNRNLALLVTLAVSSATGLAWLIKLELDEKKKKATN
ncbi:hypothetical protein RFF05_16365 [Bengtsoniella intestinalis]|uniref:hypothetical protein n=1 Tax=Bengtsoniella intestinalis TaxID=3073143 RepID=UPI00391EED5C